MKDVRAFTVIGIRGRRDGDTGTIAVWPIFDRQDWVNVEWSDGVIETVNSEDITVPNETQQIERHREIEIRLHELDRMSKIRLLRIVEILARNNGASWIMGGPRYWSKDELITGILNMEYSDTGLPY